MAARCRLRQRQRLPRNPVHAAGLGVLDHLRQERHPGGARLGPGPVPDRLRHPGIRKELLDRGVQISEVFHNEGVYAGTDEPFLFGRVRVSGPDPEHRSYRSFASFRDPDGNGWLFQEITTRLAGRIDPAATTFASANDLAGAMRRASAAHGEHEKRIGAADPNWPDWYAAYMVAEQAGEELPK